MAEAKVTLNHKKNLRDAETTKKPALLAKLKAACGVDFEFDLEPKFDDFVVGLIKGGSKYHERIGEGLYNDDGYLMAVVKLFEKQCKDDMIKEGLVDAISKKKIVLGLTETDPDYTNCIKFKDGVMYLYTSPKKFYLWLNFYSDFDVSKIL